MPELSAEEFAALQAAVRAEGMNDAAPPARTARGQAAAPIPPQNIRRYDFRIPDKFPKDVLRQINHLHDGMARTLTTQLSAQLRATIRVEDPRAEQRTYQEFVREASDPAILAAFAAEPLMGSALLEVDPIIAFPMIDRLLGGSGDGHGPARPVTEIELGVIHRVLQAILDAWRDAWSHVSVLRPRILGVETNPLFTQVVAPTEIVLAVTCVCGLGHQEGRIRLCFPHTMIEPLLSRLASRQWVASSSEPPGAREVQLRSGLTDVLVAVSVELGRLRLPLRRVLGLHPGDLLPLGVPHGSPARLHIHGQPKFLGQIGRQGRHLALQIAAEDASVGAGPWAVEPAGPAG